MNQALICADYVVPMTPGNPVIVDRSVLVDAAGRIADVGTSNDLRVRHPRAAVRELKNRVLMPEGSHFKASVACAKTSASTGASVTVGMSFGVRASGRR